MDLPKSGLHGAYLRRDIVDHCGRHRLSKAIDIGELRALWTGVVVEARRWLDPWTRAAAAQLSIGPRMALVGATAAFLHGCVSVDSTRTHAVVPYGRGVRSRRGLVVHHADSWAGDVVDLDGLQVLPLDRVVADELCTLPRARDAIALVDEALRFAADRHEEFREQIAKRIQGRLDPRGSVRGSFLLDLASERAESVPESWLRLLLIEQGFPVPEVNWRIPDISGREIYRLDLAWPAQRIAVEYDGYAAHAERAERDEARQADLERRGWIIVRVRAADLADLTRVERELRTAFARRGYVW